MAVVGNDLLFYSRSEQFFELSNFYFAGFQVDGVWWKTVEHYFQAMKSTNEDDRELVRNCPTPLLAKKIGRKIKLRSDWEQIKDGVMLRGLKEKFKQNVSLKMLLLSTGTLTLKERSPDDMYWGYKGRNRLGELLMVVRDEFSEG